MSDKPETIADIANILRIRAANISDGGAMADGAELRDMADRIEAAAERDRNAHINDIHDALYMATGIPGNAAALREALERIRPLVRATGTTPYVPERKELVDGALAIIDAALAAPARNCDRFATEDEAREAYWAYREPLEFNDKPFVAITEWLFAQAKGGAE